MSEVITNTLDLWTSARLNKSSAGRNGAQGIYGMKKLRELILELAVRGKLVSQDANDEPARVLLEQIASERDRLIQNRRIKSQREVPQSSGDEKPFDLPRGWHWAALSQLGVFSGGKTPSKMNTAYWGGDIPWVTPKDMKLLDIYDTEDHVTEAAISDGLELFEPQSVLFVVRSGILRRTFPVAINRVRCTVNQDLKVLSLFRNDVAPYVLLMMRGFERHILINLTKTGMTVESVVFDEFASHQFMLPPLAEQHRILARVDELMALCDQLEKQQTQSIEVHQTLVETLLGTLTRATSPHEQSEAWTPIASHFDSLFITAHSIDQLKQTVLQLAFRGQLVRQDPSDEPARVLLEKMAEEKVRLSREGKIREPKELKEHVPPTGKPELPAGWEWSYLGRFSHVQMGNSPPGSSYNDDGDGVPLINGPVEFAEGPFGLTKRVKFTTAPTYMCLEGDILVCVRGATTGRTNIASADSCIGRGVALVRAWESQPYINLFMWHIGNKLLEAGKGTTFPSISYSDLATWPLPIPPLKEQHRIVGKVEDLMGLCDTLKSRLAETQNTHVQLADAIVELAVA